jgi:hypothetical protein
MTKVVASTAGAICNKALLPSNGRQIYFGDVDEAFE